MRLAVEAGRGREEEEEEDEETCASKDAPPCTYQVYIYRELRKKTWKDDFFNADVCIHIMYILYVCTYIVNVRSECLQREEIFFPQRHVLLEYWRIPDIYSSELTEPHSCFIYYTYLVALAEIPDSLVVFDVVRVVQKDERLKRDKFSCVEKEKKKYEKLQENDRASNRHNLPLHNSCA